MGFKIDRLDNVIRIHIDDTDDIGCYIDERRIYFLYDYMDSYENTEPETVELVVNLILKNMMKRFTKLMIMTMDDQGNVTSVHWYPCSFSEFKYDYEMEDVFYNDYFVGYIDLPDLSEAETREVDELVSSTSTWHDGAISIIYEDSLNLVVPIVDMLIGNGSDFFDNQVLNSKAYIAKNYLTENGFTAKDLQRNFDNLEKING